VILPPTPRSTYRSHKWPLSCTFPTTIMYKVFVCPVSAGWGSFSFVVHVTCHSKLRIHSQDRPISRIRITNSCPLSAELMGRWQTPQRWGSRELRGSPDIQNCIIICGFFLSTFYSSDIKQYFERSNFANNCKRGRGDTIIKPKGGTQPGICTTDLFVCCFV
jgi:hypothetical protein